MVGTPGAKDVLTTDREFKAFKGFEVLVKVGGWLDGVAALRPQAEAPQWCRRQETMLMMLCFAVPCMP